MVYSNGTRQARDRVRTRRSYERQNGALGWFLPYRYSKVTQLKIGESILWVMDLHDFLVGFLRYQYLYSYGL